MVYLRTMRKFDKKPERGPNKPQMSVFDFLNATFMHFAPHGEAIDEASLIRISIAGRCPNADTARTLIQQMISQGHLREQIDPTTGEKAYTWTATKQSAIDVD